MHTPSLWRLPAASFNLVPIETLNPIPVSISFQSSPRRSDHEVELLQLLFEVPFAESGYAVHVSAVSW